MLNKNEWLLFDNNSSGYAGKRRNQLWAERDARFGAGNWRSIWLVAGDNLEYQDACLLYEAANFEYLKKRPKRRLLKPYGPAPMLLTRKIEPRSCYFARLSK